MNTIWKILEFLNLPFVMFMIMLIAFISILILHVSISVLTGSVL